MYACMDGWPRFGCFCPSTITWSCEPISFSRLLYSLCLSARHPPSYVPVTLRGATSQKSHLQSSVLIKSTPSSTIQKLELKITEARGSYVIRQCNRLSETKHFQGCIKAVGGGRNQGGKPKLHKAAKEWVVRGWGGHALLWGRKIKMVARIRKNWEGADKRRNDEFKVRRTLTNTIVA
jgi:hypothetical protein